VSVGKSLVKAVSSSNMDGWFGRIFAGCGLFDPDKPIKEFTKKGTVEVRRSPRCPLRQTLVRRGRISRAAGTGRRDRRP
jgi:hypothetical protein